MLGLSSSCDATVRLTRKASIPEKTGDVKEFDKGKRWNAVLPGGKSDDTMFLPVGKSDAPCGAMCAFGTLRIYICHCEERDDVAISRKGILFIKPTQDTFVLAWRKKAQTSIRVSIAAPTMRFQQRSLRRGTCTFPLFSTYTVFTLEA